MRETLLKQVQAAIFRFIAVARLLWRDIIRLSELLRERPGARRQGAVLQKAATGNTGSISHDIL